MAANVWDAVPSMLWTGLATGVVFYFRVEFSQLLSHLILRIRSGARMKIGSLEIDALRTAQLHALPRASESSESERPHEAGEDGARDQADSAIRDARRSHYHETRRIMLVHRLFRSSAPDQIYDVLIYLTPHGRASLVEVKRAEYYFGRFWGHKVFDSVDRSRGFPVLTAAYGTFLCVCRVSFNDGQEIVLERYIDFEMGAYAPLLEKEGAE